MDGSFVECPKDNGFFDHYSENLGTNVYAKTAHLVRKEMEKPIEAKKLNQHQGALSRPREFDMLSDQLGLGAAVGTSSAPPIVPNGMLNLSDMLGMVSFDILEGKKGSSVTPTVAYEGGKGESRATTEDLGDLV